jgi:release factor glutamine methyltransferase
MDSRGERLSGEQLLRWRRSLLSAGGRPADLDWLIDLAGGLGWQALQAVRLHPERSLQLRLSCQALAALWQRHLEADEPLQYLIGRCPWRDLELAVAPGVLIPRAETELLVDLAQQLLIPQRQLIPQQLLIPQQPSSPPRLLIPPLPPANWADLGTGSGCLAVALARLWPESRGFAVDLSPQALAQAGANLVAADLSDRVQTICGSWWQPLAAQRGLLELVVANPPYIPTAMWRQLEPLVRDHEPAMALDGGADGLDAIRSIVAGASVHLAPGGLLLLEHHHDQSSAVLALLRQSGLEAVCGHSDLEGTLRFASARRPID